MNIVVKILILVWAGIIVNDKVWINHTRVKWLACLTENHGMINWVLHNIGWVVWTLMVREWLILISRFCMILGLLECIHDVEMINALLIILFQLLSQIATLSLVNEWIPCTLLGLMWMIFHWNPSQMKLILNNYPILGYGRALMD